MDLVVEIYKLTDSIRSITYYLLTYNLFMQFAVPQFTDFEDKLIGPLTLKQFLFLLGIGGIVMFFYSLLGIGIFFFLFATPVALAGIGLTFGKYNGRPLFGYSGAMLSFISRPSARIFIREEPVVSISFQKPKQIQVALKPLEPAESRLKKLAYLLDKKTAEEEELLQK